jgi:CDP-4-dehydro-6-deoxyglucose reductase
MTARLIDSREIAPAVRHFVFEADAPLQFEAGQFVSFTAEIGGKKITRAYSLAAAPQGGSRFELCLNRVERGHLSPKLFALRSGEGVEMRPPLGTFTLRNVEKEAVFIATGTGIAPFRAMLQAHLAASPGMTLLFGVRHESGILYREEFEELAARFPHFTFAPTLTRPEAGWRGRTGRVQAHLAEAIAGRRNPDFYICGLKQMVDEVRNILKGMGYDRKQIFSEKYD